MNKKLLKTIDATFLVSFSVSVVALTVGFVATMRATQTGALVVLFIALAIAIVSATARIYISSKGDYEERT